MQLVKVGDTILIKAKVEDVFNMTEEADEEAREIRAVTSTGKQIHIGLKDVAQIQAAKGK